MTRLSPSRTTLRLAGDAAGLDRAAPILRDGGLVAFPTETVYGLGADATDGRAVAGIYEAKGRPRFNPLIAHVASAEAAGELAVFDSDARRLADAFWPGPLTLVLPARRPSLVGDIARAGLDTVAVRVPAGAIARALLERVGRPVAAPSANRSGHVSPTEAAHVLADLDGHIDAVVDGGPTTVGLESTILACHDGAVRLLRPGGVPAEAVEAVLGRPLAGPAGGAPIAPGMLASHYAPRARLRLDADAPAPGEAWLGFGPDPADLACLHRTLSPSGDLAEAAQALFGLLRALDAEGATDVAVAPIPAYGLGLAIRDRLARAAAER